MPTPQRNGTAAEQLLRARDQNLRAQELIDADPEEAKAVLDKAAAVDASAGELTMRDVFGLFLQLQQQQQAMQQQLLTVLSDAQRRSQVTQRNTAEELANDKLQREKTLEAWRTEPREPVWIEPDLTEKKIAAVQPLGEMPPRVFRVNGLEFPVPVGQVIEVPQSIAALVRYHQNPKAKPTPWDMQRQVQGLPQIADPARGQFLAGAAEISPGKAGLSGEGRIQPTPVAASADQAGPLDFRYDAFGR
jgi:hypothetical protein